MKKIGVILIALMTISFNIVEKKEYRKSISIPPTKSFFKAIEVRKGTSIAIRSSTSENKRFDFNIFDYKSYKKYNKSKDMSKLKIVNKITDIYQLDTLIHLKSGKYYLNWENYENRENITLIIDITFDENIEFPKLKRRKT